MAFSSLPDDQALWLELDVRAIGEALLDGDLLEARFRTAQLVAPSGDPAMASVRAAAGRLQELLHPVQSPPGAAASFTEINPSPITA